jgi:phage shock protein PspC (stress-responsive transcriptional regulator)
MSSDLPPIPPPTDPTGPTAPPSSPSSPPPDGLHRNSMDEFFDRVRGLGVVRPSDGRWAAGVASGLARRWDIDVVLVRGIFVALTLIGGLGVAAYGVCWLLFPQDDGRIHLQAALRGHVTAGFVGAALLALSAIGGNGGGPWHNGYWFGWGFPGSLILTLLIIGGIWWYARRETEKSRLSGDGESSLPPVPPTTTTASPAASAPGTPVYGSPVPGTASPDAYRRMAEESRRIGEHARAEAVTAVRASNERRAATRPSRRVVRSTLGVALLAAAVILFVGNRADWEASVGVVAAATALGVIALGVIVSGVLGRRSSGLAGLGVLLAVATLIGAGAQHAGVDSGQNLTAVGDRTWQPTTVAAAQRQFNLGVGSATLYLTDPGILPRAGNQPVNVRARLAVGELTVVLPDDVSSQVNLRLSAGEVVRPDGVRVEVRPNDGNHRQSYTTGPAGAPDLVLDVQQGAGQLRITTASRMNQPAPAIVPTPGTAPTPDVTPSVTPSASATTN